MYIFNCHHIEPKPSVKSRTHITLPPKGLRQFIRALRTFGYTFVSLKDVLKKGGPEKFPAKSILLTFDDGYANFAEHALPVLIQEKCPATMFLLADKIGQSNDWDSGEENDRLLNQDELRSMKGQKLITFGSHGLSHRLHEELSETELQAEILDSYTILSKMVGKQFLPVYAYPWGNHTQTAIQILEKSPYQLAFTTGKGRWADIQNKFTIPRFSLFNRDQFLPILIAKLLRHGISISLFNNCNSQNSKPQKGFTFLSANK